MVALSMGCVWVVSAFGATFQPHDTAIQSCPPCPDADDLCAVAVDRAARSTRDAMSLYRFRYDDVTLWEGGRCVAGTYRHNAQRFDCSTHPAQNPAWGTVRVVTGLSVVDLEDGKGPFISADVVLANPVDGGVK
jgi:hypothetical protein